MRKPEMLGLKTAPRIDPRSTGNPPLPPEHTDDRNPRPLLQSTQQEPPPH